MWLLIDNDDSFTNILADNIMQFHSELMVLKHDKYKLQEIIEMQPERMIFSAGPGKPEDATICKKLLSHYETKIPILGICLGHQVICIHYGGSCHTSGLPTHGLTSRLNILKSDTLFRDVTNLEVMHYHSLICDHLSDTELELVAIDDHNWPMVVRHKRYPILGIQYHPESILTTDGLKMIRNWVENPN